MPRAVTITLSFMIDARKLGGGSTIILPPRRHKILSLKNLSAASTAPLDALTHLSISAKKSRILSRKSVSQNTLKFLENSLPKLSGNMLLK
jgi:hypothetical protein